MALSLHSNPIVTLLRVTFSRPCQVLEARLSFPIFSVCSTLFSSWLYSYLAQSQYGLEDSSFLDYEGFQSRRCLFYSGSSPRRHALGRTYQNINYKASLRAYNLCNCSWLPVPGFPGWGKQGCRSCRRKFELKLNIQVHIVLEKIVCWEEGREGGTWQ